MLSTCLITVLERNGNQVIGWGRERGSVEGRVYLVAALGRAAIDDGLRKKILVRGGGEGGGRRRRSEGPE